MALGQYKRDLPTRCCISAMTGAVTRMGSTKLSALYFCHCTTKLALDRQLFTWRIIATSDLLSYFFVKKIPLSRRVEYVKDGSMDHSVSELVSE